MGKESNELNSILQVDEEEQANEVAVLPTHIK
jgi:hypothetical protein